MSVVNVKSTNLRPKYNNLEEWMTDPINVYIGPTKVVMINGFWFPQQNSIWANPYRVGRDGDRDQVLSLYRQLLSLRRCNKQLIALKGKTLGCWCKPEPCHGDILLEFVNRLSDASPPAENIDADLPDWVAYF